MSALLNLFGKAQAQKSNPKDAILRLRENIDMLDKREKYLEAKIATELQTAKQNAVKNKRVALTALKRKKQYELQTQKMGQSRMTLETQVLAIESANMNLETLSAMRAGAEAMKSIHGAMDIGKVDSVMDEIRDQMDIANEIGEAIGQPIGGLDMDEDELLEELELLEQEELDSKLLNGEGGLETAPIVPKTVIPAIAMPPRPSRKQVVDEDEDAELAELKASMAL